MKSQILPAYQSAKCLVWVSPFPLSSFCQLREVALGQWFSPISSLQWFSWGRMVVVGKDGGGGRGTDTEAKTGYGVSEPLRSSLRFYLEKLCV